MEPVTKYGNLYLLQCYGGGVSPGEDQTDQNVVRPTAEPQVQFWWEEQTATEEKPTRRLNSVCALNVCCGTVSENVKVIKTNCKMREAWPVTCRLTRWGLLRSAQPLPALSSDCCTSPCASVGKLPLKTFAQQHTTTTPSLLGEDDGFLALRCISHTPRWRE